MQKRTTVRVTLIAAASLLTSHAYAVAPGFYMGFMGGPATNNASNKNVQLFVNSSPPPSPPVVAPATPKSTQFGSRIFLGYKFNQLAGFEWGLTYFSGIKYDVKYDKNNPAQFLPNGQPRSPCGGSVPRVRDIDFVGKVEYAFKETFGIFGKAGAALVYTTTPGSFNPNTRPYSSTPVPNANPPASITNPAILCGTSNYTGKISPTFSIGASYDIDQNWVADLSATTVMTGNYINSATMYALGISYHFVDKYCGQFLCD